jgi:Putative amidase domain
MALERAPQIGSTPGTQTLEELKTYSPPLNKIYDVFTVRAGQTLGDVAKAANREFWDYVEFVFPGCNKDPQCVNWYLANRLHCPDTPDKKNRMFKGGEKLALPMPKTPGAPGPLEPVEPKAPAAYVRDRAVNYALRYVHTHNPQFVAYTDDCTNFVSQALLAGGFPMVGGSASDYGNTQVWWYGKATAPDNVLEDVLNFLKNKAGMDPDGSAIFQRYLASKSWASAQRFHDFLQRSGRARAVDDYLQLQPGDVVQVHNGSYVHHTFFVVKKTQTDLYLANHSGRAPLRWLHADVMTNITEHEYFIFWKIRDGLN